MTTDGLSAKEMGFMCPHVFRETDKPGYVVCSRCGTYHSTQFGDPTALYSNDYWSHGTGHSTIQEQVFNVTQAVGTAAVSKNDKIMQHVPTRGDVALEVACAPGELLKRLAERFAVVFGNEVDPAYEAEIREVCGNEPRLVFGLFPEVTRKFPVAALDCFIGLDVFEHVPDSMAFVDECARLLKPGGTLILLSPFVYADGVFEDKMFHPVEHVWIYSDTWLKEAFGGQFTELRFDRWLPGHELFVATRQTGPTRPAPLSGKINYDDWCPVTSSIVAKKVSPPPAPKPKPATPMTIARAYLAKGDMAEARRGLELAVLLHSEDQQLKAALDSLTRTGNLPPED